MDDVPEVWKEWKLTHEWQESVFQLLQKNDEQIIIDLSGIHNLPQGADPEKYSRDLSLFILLFLYCEVPYQMGVYEICMHHKKTGQTEIGKRYPSDEKEISDTLSLENPLFSKMRASTGLRNFVMKYIGLRSKKRSLKRVSPLIAHTLKAYIRQYRILDQALDDPKIIIKTQSIPFIETFSLERKILELRYYQ